MHTTNPSAVRATAPAGAEVGSAGSGSSIVLGSSSSMLYRMRLCGAGSSTDLPAQLTERGRLVQVAVHSWARASWGKCAIGVIEQIWIEERESCAERGVA